MFILYKQKRPSFSFEFGTNNHPTTANTDNTSQAPPRIFDGSLTGRAKLADLALDNSACLAYFTVLCYFTILHSLEGSTDLPQLPARGIKTHSSQTLQPERSCLELLTGEKDTPARWTLTDTKSLTYFPPLSLKDFQ